MNSIDWAKVAREIQADTIAWVAENRFPGEHPASTRARRAAEVARSFRNQPRITREDLGEAGRLRRVAETFGQSFVPLFAAVMPGGTPREIALDRSARGKADEKPL